MIDVRSALLGSAMILLACDPVQETGQDASSVEATPAVAQTPVDPTLPTVGPIAEVPLDPEQHPTAAGGTATVIEAGDDEFAGDLGRYGSGTIPTIPGGGVVGPGCREARCGPTVPNPLAGGVTPDLSGMSRRPGG